MAGQQGGRCVKRYGGLWEKVIVWENLRLAARKARKGKRDRAGVQRFEFDLESNLLALRSELADGTYRPGPFSTHWITRPKPRLISAAPYRDRVLHHALMNILEPILDRHFHPDSYACRRGKGTHAAADRLQGLMRRYHYALQCDIRKFFPSIDHQVLKGMFRRLIKDSRILWLMDLIVDGSNAQESVVEWFDDDDLFAPAQRRRGLPIGNLTSQWFANWMLNGLDHFVTSGLGMGAYVRYCDDFIILGDDRASLKRAAAQISRYLSWRRLRLHEEKVSVRPVQAGLTFVGYRIWPTHRLLRKKNVRHFRRRVRWMKGAYACGRTSWQDIKPRLISWMGHASQADSRRLVGRLSREWVFSKGRDDNVACVARRVVG
jgi:RNA-directed DNA polymerase